MEKERDGDRGRGGYLLGGVLAGGCLGLHGAPAAGHLEGSGTVAEERGGTRAK